MTKVNDIEGNELNVGDTVYYARKRDYKANGELIKATITSINTNGIVLLGSYTSTNPESQLLKKKV